MKKRFLLPCLLLVSSLTACGGGSGGGLVTGGKQYKEGDAANVDSAVKAQKEDSIKKVILDEKVDFSYKLSAQGQSYSMTEKVDGRATIDIDAKTIEGAFKFSGSTGGQKQNESVNFKVQRNDNGYYETVSGNYEIAFNEDSLEEIFDMAYYTVYSWNFSSENGLVAQMAESAEGYGSEIEAFMREIIANMVISGDPATGTFDVGLGKAVKLDYQGINFSFNKMKYSYKDCYLKNVVLGLKGSGSYSYGGQSASISISETVEANYSYEFRA